MLWFRWDARFDDRTCRSQDLIEDADQPRNFVEGVVVDAGADTAAPGALAEAIDEARGVEVAVRMPIL